MKPAKKRKTARSVAAAPTASEVVPRIEPITCSVCTFAMTKPFAAPCGHMLCGLCVHRLVVSANTMMTPGLVEATPCSYTIKCPTCQKVGCFQFMYELDAWLETSFPNPGRSLDDSTLWTPYNVLRHYRRMAPNISLRLRVFGNFWSHRLVSSILVYWMETEGEHVRKLLVWLKEECKLKAILQYTQLRSAGLVTSAGWEGDGDGVQCLEIQVGSNHTLFIMADANRVVNSVRGISDEYERRMAEDQIPIQPARLVLEGPHRISGRGCN